MNEGPARPAIGHDTERVDGHLKVTGSARYACEYPVDSPAYLHIVGAPEARGRVVGVDTAQAEKAADVLGVLWHGNAPRLRPAEPGGLSLPEELAVLQSAQVSYRGQAVAVVAAESPEAARQAATEVTVHMEAAEHDARFSGDRDDAVPVGKDQESGDVDGAMAAAHAHVDAVYTTPMTHNNPMEPHSTIALWEEDGLTLYESTQGPHTVQETLAPMLGLAPERIRVIAPYVGGGFGSKGPLHAPTLLAVLAARAFPGRPVKLAVTRQDMFDHVGYRSPTRVRVRLGSDRRGRLACVAVDAMVQSAHLADFIEEAAAPSRVMYAAEARRAAHRAVRLDVAPPGWMRGPGRCPGMFGPEVAMDELAEGLGIDPVELRLANEPDLHPVSGRPFSSRNLRACLLEGAQRFGWEARARRPRSRSDGEWLVGLGVAASTYPAEFQGGSSAEVRFEDGRYAVRIGASDIGTGAWTALTLIAADTLGVAPERVDLRIGGSDLPGATVAGGSTGTVSWGTAVAEACRAFSERHGADPPAGAQAASTADEPESRQGRATHAFGAQFAEVRVSAVTGEVRVPRLLGVFAVGRIISPRTARSQLTGGMTMGLSMALHEESHLDPRSGRVVTRDLADYHIAANADAPSVEAYWVDERDPYVNALGAKGIGEIGIVGTAAAIANAAYNATGVRVRDLPLTLDRFLA